jgi:hypothetical protein
VTLSIPTELPGSVTAGDTVIVSQGPFDVPGGSAAPVDGWTLAVRIIADSSYSATVTDDDAQTWTITFAASLMAAVVTQTVGRLVGYVTGSGDYADQRYKVIDQPIVIEPNPETATATNLKTHAERTLAIIEAAIEGTLPSAMSSYSIGGRAVTKYSPAELMGLRARYAWEVKQQRNGGAMLGMQMAFNAQR